MCVIVHQPKGSHLTKQLAKELWKENPDGGGFAFLDDDSNLRVEKFMDFPTYWNKFETMRSRFPERDFLMHMRIATHGSVSVANVHPFQVDNYTVMAHNGIIHAVTKDLEMDKTDDRTDSEVFVEEVIRQLPRLWLDNKYLKEMVEEYVGWSRLMFLTDDPQLKHSVYKLGDWEWEEGVHLSNLNHLYVPKEAHATGWESVNMGVVENSEDWDAWLDYQKNREADAAANAKPLDWELDMLIDGLKAERMQMYISHPLILIDDSPQIECSGCLQQVDIETAECGCWDTACLNCMRFMAYCNMEVGCSVETMVDVDNLDEGMQNALMGYSDSKAAKELAAPW